MNFYDTAIAYQGGTSEQYVGRALRVFAKRDIQRKTEISLKTSAIHVRIYLSFKGL